MEFLDQIARLLDPIALAIVFTGSLTAALLRGGLKGASAGLSALGPCFSVDPDSDALAAIVAVGQVEQIAQAKSVATTDRVSTRARFLREAVRQLSSATNAEAFARWTRETIDARRRRHAVPIAFWRDIADAAPAMGMIATVLGLVRMFAAMDDPSHIGAPMATALVATLWGILVANLVAGPVADRLERLSDAELAWQIRTLDHFATLATRELARTPAPPPRSYAA